MNWLTNKLGDFRARQDAINRNPELSAEGKAKAAARLNTEIAAYRTQVLGFLAGDWDNVRQRYFENLEGARQAEEKAASSWDYNRLNYLARQVVSDIERASGVPDLQRAYNQAKARERHVARAWAEHAPDIIQRRFSNHAGAGALATEMRQDLEKLLDTPELQAARERGSKITQRAVEVRQATDTAMRFFHPHGAGSNPYGGDSLDFHRLGQGARLGYRVDPETTAEIWTLEFDPQEVGAGG